MKTTTHLQETVEILIGAGAVAPSDRKSATTAIEHDIEAGYLEPVDVRRARSLSRARNPRVVARVGSVRR